MFLRTQCHHAHQGLQTRCQVRYVRFVQVDQMPAHPTDGLRNCIRPLSYTPAVILPPDLVIPGQPQPDSAKAHQGREAFGRTGQHYGEPRLVLQQPLPARTLTPASRAISNHNPSKPWLCVLRELAHFTNEPLHVHDVIVGAATLRKGPGTNHAGQGAGSQTLARMQ